MNNYEVIILESTCNDTLARDISVHLKKGFKRVGELNVISTIKKDYGRYASQSDVIYEILYIQQMEMLNDKTN